MRLLLASHFFKTSKTKKSPNVISFLSIFSRPSFPSLHLNWTHCNDRQLCSSETLQFFRRNISFHFFLYFGCLYHARFGWFLFSNRSSSDQSTVSWFIMLATVDWLLLTLRLSIRLLSWLHWPDQIIISVNTTEYIRTRHAHAHLAIINSRKEAFEMENFKN